MALVQAKGLFRLGFLEKVSRFVSPPNPSGPTSYLWKSDSFSMQKRALLLARMSEFKVSFFSSTQVVTTQAAEIHTNSTLQDEAAPEQNVKSNVTSTGTSSNETDPDVLERNYGEEQADHQKVAESTHDHHIQSKDDDESDSLEKAGFDMSKMSRPSGDE